MLLYNQLFKCLQVYLFKYFISYTEYNYKSCFFNSINYTISYWGDMKKGTIPTLNNKKFFKDFIILIWKITILDFFRNIP